MTYRSPLSHYDRALLAQTTSQTSPTEVDPEAVMSRTTSAAGFARPTRDMLGEAQQHAGTRSQREVPEAPAKNASRGQHRQRSADGFP